MSGELISGGRKSTYTIRESPQIVYGKYKPNDYTNVSASKGGCSKILHKINKIKEEELLENIL